ncbi:MAG: tetratricopeptide repeat protein, partial [Pseudomonadota bacterium]
MPTASLQNPGIRASQPEIDRSLAEFVAGRLPTAEQAAIQLCRNYPEDAFGWKLHAAILQALGKFEEALVPALQSVALAPHDAEAISNLGAALQSTGRLNEAETQLRAAVALSPSSAEANNNLGNVLRGKGLNHEAEQYYAAALQLKPGWAEAHLNLGIALTDTHRLVEAGEAFERASALNPALVQAFNSRNMNRVSRSDFSEIVTGSDHALLLDPEGYISWEQRLYCFSYHPDLSAAQIYREFERWGERFPMPVTDFSRHDRTPGRRLRIG